ncbi:MAG: DUF4412 domain-containing protein, partial [Bacteroidetes bacterium]
LLAFLFLATTLTGFAQKKMSSGFVQYEISDIKSDMAELNMLKGTQMNLFFTDAKQKVDVAIMGGMMRFQTIIDNQSADNNAVLMDMMGKKIQVAGLNGEGANQNPMMNLGAAGEKLNYTVHKKDKKKIAGYKCRKAVASLPQGMALKVYYTKKIQPKNSYMQQAMGGLDGFPLEFTIDTGSGVAVTFTAKEVAPKVDASTFAIPAGYEKMSLEQLQEELGGMNFGF